MHGESVRVFHCACRPLCADHRLHHHTMPFRQSRIPLRWCLAQTCRRSRQRPFASLAFCSGPVEQASCSWPVCTRPRLSPQAATGNNPTTSMKAANHSTQTRSLRSRSRIDWAVEAARRVRGGLVVAAHGGAGAPTGAGSERPTCKAGEGGKRRLPRLHKRVLLCILKCLSAYRSASAS